MDFAEYIMEYFECYISMFKQRYYGGPVNYYKILFIFANLFHISFLNFKALLDMNLKLWK